MYSSVCVCVLSVCEGVATKLYYSTCTYMYYVRTCVCVCAE